jgi:hypothetical protein
MPWLTRNVPRLGAKKFYYHRWVKTDNAGFRDTEGTPNGVPRLVGPGGTPGLDNDTKKIPAPRRGATNDAYRRYINNIILPTARIAAIPKAPRRGAALGRPRRNAGACTIQQKKFPAP